MEIEEFRLALTKLIQLMRANDSHVATLWQDEELIAIQKVPRGFGATSIRVPIVELLRSQGERMGQNYIVASTFPPTVACFGMARMCGVFRLNYFHGDQIVSATTPRMKPVSYYRVSDKPTTTIPEVNPKAKWYKATGDPKNALLAWTTNVKEPSKLDAIERAKKMTWSPAIVKSAFPVSPLEYLGLRRVVGGDQNVMDNILMMMAFEMIARVSGFRTNDRTGKVTSVRVRSDARKGQNIGGILADDEGNIVGWGYNTNTENSTRHGETNLVSQYLENEEALPNNGTLYSTLEPCEMCSGIIVRAVKGTNRFRVLYGQEDANLSATALKPPPSNITMTYSKAVMVNAAKAAPLVGTSGGQLNFAGQIGGAKADSKTPETTAFLKESQTYKTYLSQGRPAWWMYLYENAIARLAKANVKDLMAPEALRVNNELTVIYDLSERFMNMVEMSARSD
jgi:tRNA(Arg) A34 adenosine deaminase TadA